MGDFTDRINKPSIHNTAPLGSMEDLDTDYLESDTEIIADHNVPLNGGTECKMDLELTEKEQQKRISYRIGKSIALYMSFLGLGLAASVTGPSIVTMERLLNTDTLTISGAFMAGGLGYLCGALICSVAFDRANKEMQFSLSIIFQAIFIAVAPFTGNVYWFIVMNGLCACSMGFIDSGGNSYVLILWGGHRIQGPFMQGIHTTWSLGATLGPLIVRGFLVDLDPGANKSITNITLPNTSGILTEEPDVGLVRFAYVTIACLVVISGISFFVLFLLTGAKAELSRKTQKQNRENSRSTSKHFRIILLILLFIHFHMVVYVEGCTGSYIAPFVVKHLSWDNRMGAVIYSVFQGGIGIGRLTNVGIATCLQPRTMLIMNLVSTLGCYILLCFAEYHNIIVWISVALAGFCQSSTFPTSVLWASEYIEVTGLAAAVFILGAASAGIIFPIIVGKLFVTQAQMKMIYMILIMAILQLFFFIFMQLFAHFCQKRKLAKELKVETGEKD